MKKRIAALLFAGILALAPAGGTAFNPTGGGIWQTVSAVEPRSAPATLVVCDTVIGSESYWITDAETVNYLRAIQPIGTFTMMGREN